jgi:hypothetical protein
LVLYRLNGQNHAKILLGNMDTTLFYSPNDLDTARYLEEFLGNISAYAHSQTLHSGQESSEGRSERPRPLLSTQEITQLKDTDVLVWHRGYKPLKLKRMDWRAFPLLIERRNISPPPLHPLPRLTDIELREPHTLPSDDLPSVELDDPDDLVDPDNTTFSLKGELGWRKIAMSAYDEGSISVRGGEEGDVCTHCSDPTEY